MYKEFTFGDKIKETEESIYNKESVLNGPLYSNINKNLNLNKAQDNLHEKDSKDVSK